MEIVLIELSLTAGVQGAKYYLKHRERMIAENREDELVSSRVKKYINNKLSQSADSDKDSVASSHSSRFHHWLKSITPGRRRTGLGLGLSPALGESQLTENIEFEAINPEFQEFVRKLLVFVKNEAICQAENPNSHLLKHKHYQQLLILSLMDQHEKDHDAVPSTS
jgi:hypothetical protein